MPTVHKGKAVPGLERSCKGADWFHAAPACRGLERIEARFAGHAFDPHRHDTYAIGVTLQGVQSFRYRGRAENSLPGQVLVLHPDETHDGHAGTEAGFRYRILYVDPGLIRDALADRRCALPFLREPISSDHRLAMAVKPALEDLGRPFEELERDHILLALAEALAAADPSLPRRRIPGRDWRAVERARGYLDANLRQGVRSMALEAETGLTRYALARQFRACLGTSPYRYLVMRRLDRVRAQIRRGRSLAEAALDSGFADQSHMTRHFKKAYGVTPKRWAGFFV